MPLAIVAHCSIGRRINYSILYLRLLVLQTTVPSERVFSTAGNIVTDKRTPLDIDTVEMLLFLNKNIHLNENYGPTLV